MKKIMEFLSGVPMTIVSGAFLAASLVLSAKDKAFLIDPAWLAVAISGVPILFSAIRKLIFNKGVSKISSALLISVAMLAAIAIGDLFAAGEVAFIMAIGEILEDKTTERAKRGLKKLISLSPQRGRLILNGEAKMLAAEEIKVGDILRVLPGEAIPVDGEIISGETSVDQSVMTGEALPIDKGVGDSVFCGTINRFGAVDIRATRVGGDSSLSKLIRMVREAEDKKAPMQRIADKWASWLVPAAMLIAVITYIVTRDITRAVTVLVVFCPCALVLATPTAIMAAIGQAAKRGVVIKSGDALEKMGRVDTIAFDKTGTLTKGKLKVSDVTLSGVLSEEELICYAASAESKSEHPLGKAILSFAGEKGVKSCEPQAFKMRVGKGVSATVEGNVVLCGNESFVTDSGIKIPENIRKSLDTLRSHGKASVIVCVNNEVGGIIALSDTLREESGEVVKKLKKMGTASVLLTGDNARAAEFFAKKIGISDVFAELLPHQKVEAASKMQSEGKTVCMIGDGVNDAPALKAADVGVAMGGEGCDIAVEAADIALMSDDISKIPYLKRLSNETVRTIKLSISASLIINAAAIILSFFGILTPTTGALVHNLGSVLVVLFAASLYDRKFR